MDRSTDLTGSLWKAVFYTALLLGVILGGAMLMKKYGGERFSQTSSPDIEIIGRKYLNPKQSIAIVKVRKKELLLGITDQSIQLLDRLDTDET
ncbi:MAG: flagellar biosynthetic protein FliO [Candidatus Marinimicrobia bacterium]|nr:flagellar biosynthetic protein FliO [Candidatus Neomarinimicrobiota bacterium]